MVCEYIWSGSQFLWSGIQRLPEFSKDLYIMATQGKAEVHQALEQRQKAQSDYRDAWGMIRRSRSEYETCEKILSEAEAEEGSSAGIQQTCQNMIRSYWEEVNKIQECYPLHPVDQKEFDARRGRMKNID